MDKPPITRTTKLLPFGDLSPQEFEGLCLWLVKREGYVRAQHFGEVGNEQGRDIIAYKPTDTGEQLWYFQCKRHKKITAGVLQKEVDKYNQLTARKPSAKPVGVVFLISAPVSAAVSEQTYEYCATHGYKVEIWAHRDLDERVKGHVDIVLEFFGPSWVTAIRGSHQPDHSAGADPPSGDTLARVMDRYEQEETLEEAIRKHCANPPGSPLVCVVHGNAVECHDAYLDRLKDSLPNLLPRHHPELAEDPPVLPLEMNLSRILKTITDDNWKEIFWSALRDAINESEGHEEKISPERIVRLIPDDAPIVLIGGSLLADSFEGVAPDRLNHFFEFWNREFWDLWKDLSGKRILVVCLSLRYQNHHKASLLSRPLKLVWLNRRLRWYVSKVEKNLGAYENLHGVCLPELIPIKESHAIEAISHPLVKQHRDLRGLRERDVTRIYKQYKYRRPRGRIPMGDLLDGFEEALRRRHYDR